MSKTSPSNSFIDQAKTFVLDQVSNEHFGVSELAVAMNMSRSSLLRKIKKQTNLSASQFIRNIRLEQAKELLAVTEMTVSEISFDVGFSNTSYFVKCYREYFGQPPGEFRQMLNEESSEVFETPSVDIKSKDDKKSFIQLHLNKLIVTITAIAIAVISFYFGSKDSETSTITSDKTIAVLPFKNMSSDTSNLYFVNGLMEASLNKLQKINDLRVKSRTSVEKYRNTQRSITEIAEELNVNYLVEGSGQKFGDQILLNIQLIDAKTDTPIWTEQYQYELVDIFKLQNTVAKKIALAIEANITAEEIAQIDKKPTENLLAYDLYLKAKQTQLLGGDENLLKSIDTFKTAIEADPKFALAYAQIAISYYYLDERKIEKQYQEKLNEYADKALLYDSKLDISLIAKALYYISNREFNLAIPHLEKALEYNPNSSSVVLILSDLYGRAVPNTEKYLKYSLKGIQLDIEANDSIGKSFIYLNLSNALIQNGFADKSLQYINKSLEYNPNNPYAPYLKNYILLAKDEDLGKATQRMILEYKKDTTRVDVIQEIAKLYYYQEKYKDAYQYYQKYNTLIANKGIDLYPQEQLKMAVVYKKMGDTVKAQEFENGYDKYLDSDNYSIYKPASLAVKYLYKGDIDAAIEQYQLFSTKSNFQYWVVLFLEKEPLLKQMKSHKDYEATIQKIKNQFWDNHEGIKQMLEANHLLDN